MKKKDVESVIEDLQKQIADIDGKISEKRARISKLPLRNLPSINKRRQVLSDSIAELSRKGKRLEKKIENIQLQDNALNSLILLISALKDLLQKKENRELVIEVGVSLLDAFRNMKTRADSRAVFSKSSAKILFKGFKNLQKAGFDKSEAIVLLSAMSKIELSDILNVIASQKSSSARMLLL